MAISLYARMQERKDLEESSYKKIMPYVMNNEKLKDQEKNYPMHDLELAAIIHALKMWRHYLMGRKLLLETDNMNLNYLFDQPDMNARKGIWLCFLSEYHFELKHIKGKENKVSDALSRRTHMIYEVTLSQMDAYFHEKIRTENKVDPFYVEIFKKVQEDRLFQQQKEYKVDDSGLLWSKDRLYVPYGGDIRSNILTEFHREPYSGHPRYKKMISIVKRHFFLA